MQDGWPSVTIVFLVHNRRDELRESLRRMLTASDYDPARLDAIVVDNASTDGSAAMVRDEFPGVELIVNDANVGVSGWNRGLAAARGEYVLALDDDCYLPPDGLTRAVAAARDHRADLVSFRVVSTRDPGYAFTDAYPTGLFSFWGCAVLMRRDVVRALGGYDPEIFVWANELEFMLRFFDHGFRHLYLPEVAAQHMKAPPARDRAVEWRSYRLNARHFAYVAGKLLRRGDGLAVLAALLTRNLLDAAGRSPRALRALPQTVAGFAKGMRRHDPVRNAEISRFYRDHFEVFASPWALASPGRELLRLAPRELLARPFVGRRRALLSGRRGQYFEERARLYPSEAAVLAFGPPRPAP